MSRKNWPLPMDLYNKPDKDVYRADPWKIWVLPKNENEIIGPVISITTQDAYYVVVTYTIIVGLIFAGLRKLAIYLILAFFPDINSGNFHVIFVSYYNTDSPLAVMLAMGGYIKRSLLDCRLGKRWKIDGRSLGASLSFFNFAFLLLAADLVTRYLLGGNALMGRGVAPANPDRVYYPSINKALLLQDPNNIPPEIFEGLQSLQDPAINQALARQALSQGTLDRDRAIHFTADYTYNAPERYGGRIVNNGTGVTFQWEYSITGYDMGMISAAGLRYTVKGTCYTYYGPNGNDSVFTEKNDVTGEIDRYPYPGDTNATWGGLVYLDQETYSPPWAHFRTKFDDVALNQNVEYGGYTFIIVPHSGWRPSYGPSERDGLNERDPWYLTQPNPNFNSTLQPDAKNSRYRIKRARPPLYCTQNDTYTYGGNTVKHVTKLKDLKGLHLPSFISAQVFEREFGKPVLSTVLNHLEYGSLASTTHFIANQRRLDAPRANITDDFRRLIYTSYIYSRDVLRNTVLLLPTIKQPHEPFPNAAEVNGVVPPESIDFFVESTEVVTLSVPVLASSPCICVLLWIVVLLLHKTPHSANNKNTPRTRFMRRRIPMRAANLYCALDEELSREPKWFGRTTETPYIRDLEFDEVRELEYDKDTDAGLPVCVRNRGQLQATSDTPDKIEVINTPDPVLGGSTTEKIAAINTSDPVLTDKRVEHAPQPMQSPRRSNYARSKILRIDPQPAPEPESLLTRCWNGVKSFFGREKSQPREKFVLAMTMRWDKDVKQNVDKKGRIKGEDILDTV